MNVLVWFAQVSYKKCNLHATSFALPLPEVGRKCGHEEDSLHKPQLKETVADYMSVRRCYDQLVDLAPTSTYI